MEIIKNEEYRIYLLKIYGIIQGVSFRPFIYKIAKKFYVKGWGNNTGGTVIIQYGDTKENIRNFIFIIVRKPPEFYKIEKVECKCLYKKIYYHCIIKNSVKL